MVKSVRRKAENHPTGAQLRAARGLLNMSVAELAELSGLALNTVKRAEATNDLVPLTAANAALLASTLEAEGVILTQHDDGGVGVRLDPSKASGTTDRKRRRQVQARAAEPRPVEETLEIAEQSGDVQSSTGLFQSIRPQAALTMAEEELAEDARLATPRESNARPKRVRRDRFKNAASTIRDEN